MLPSNTHGDALAFSKRNLLIIRYLPPVDAHLDWPKTTSTNEIGQEGQWDGPNAINSMSAPLSTTNAMRTWNQPKFYAVATEF